MRIGQAIDEIILDKTKEYANGKYIIKFDVEENIIDMFYKNDKEASSRCYILDSCYLGMKWKLVQKPVSFMEAVASGKFIKAEHDNLNILYGSNNLKEYRINSNKYYHLGYLLKIISMHFADEQLRAILTEGKFYIQEED